MTATEPRKAASGALYAMVDGRPRKIKATVESINEDFARLNAELRRLRISQLRRMVADASILMRSAEEALRLEQHRRHRGWPHRDCGFLRRRYMRWGRFIDRMDDEIERLRGEG